MTPLFVIYLIFSIVLLIKALVLLITVTIQFRLREKYNVFSVKFAIDIVTAGCLMAMAFLDKNNDKECGIAQVISTSVPLVQCLLLLSEVIDWSLAAFSPVYFHQSSLLCRIMPFIIGSGFSVIIMVSLIVIDLQNEDSHCSTSPANTAILTAYDISLIIGVACSMVLGLLLKKQLNSSFFKPIVFHFVATIFLLVLPVLVVIILKYGNLGNAVLAADITNLLVAVHSMAHSAHFVYNHEDIRQGFRATFLQFRVLTAITNNSTA